jgi:hypothetical protein
MTQSTARLRALTRGRLAAAAHPALLAAVLGLARGSAGHAADVPAADRIIALVRAGGCDAAQLHQEMEATTKSLVADPRAMRVVVNWPVDPVRNLDLMGRPSPVAAALETTAAPADLTAIADRVAHDLDRACKTDVYLVRTRAYVTTPRTWPLGEASPGSKLFTMLTRKDGLSLADFDAVWSGPHAKLALSWREVGHVKDGRYVQNLVVSRVGDTAPLDGIGEGEGPHAGSPAETEARMKTAQHAPSFMNMAKSAMFHAKEYILKD